MYKNFWQYSDKQDNCIDIAEYVIPRRAEKPDESRNLILSLRYEFFRENGQDSLKVTGSYLTQETHQLNIEGFQAVSWDAEGAGWSISQDGQYQQEILPSCVSFGLNDLVQNRLFYSPLDDTRVKDIWGAYILNLSELPVRDFSTQDDRFLLLASEAVENFPLQENEASDEVDMELRAIAEAAEAAEHMDNDF